MEIYIPDRVFLVPVVESTIKVHGFFYKPIVCFRHALQRAAKGEDINVVIPDECDNYYYECIDCERQNDV